MEPLRVLLADDHAILRVGLRLLLDGQEDFEVVGEAETGLEALELADSLKPDIVLLDLNMPGLHGLETLPTLRKVAPDARVLILTMHADPQYLQEAIRRGAAGYVLKKAADSELLSALRAVARGEVYVHPSMTRALLDGLIQQPQDTESNAWEELSPREQEVLRMVALGHTSAEIAQQLHLSPKTVDTYRARGMEKLGFSTRAALVRFCLRRGLLSQE